MADFTLRGDSAVLRAGEVLPCRVDVSSHLIGDREVEMRQVIDVLLRTGGHLKLLRVSERQRGLELVARGGALSLLDQSQASIVVLIPRARRRSQQQDHRKNCVNAPMLDRKSVV